MNLHRPGLRGKLALAIALVLLTALGITYVAVYRGTGSELSSRTDNELAQEVDRISTRLESAAGEDPDAYTRRARTITSAENFGPELAAIIFGWIFTGHQLGAASAAFLAGLSRSVFDTYLPALVSAGGLCILAALLILTIERKPAGRLAPAGGA